MYRSMRSLVFLLALGLAGFADEGDEKSQPVDLGKVLRESKEFAKECAKYKITWEEGRVTSLGEIVHRGGGPCEYLVGIYPSKPHETIVLLDDGPWTGKGRRPRVYVEGLATNLNNAMLAAGFEKGSPFSWDPKTREVFPPKGETVHVYCEWKDKADKEHRVRMSDWLWNHKRIQIMGPGQFVFTGSSIYDEGPPTNRKWLGAEMDGLIVAVLATTTALIDHTEDGENGVYEAVAIRIPEIGTRVKVVLSRKELEAEKFPPLKLPKELIEARKKLEAEKKKAAEEEK